MPADHSRLIALAVAYDRGDARRIHHFMKVYAFASAIAWLEGVDSATRHVLEAAAILHDIGIHECERKYGNCDGKHQEEEGPAVARGLMADAGGYTEAQVERVCRLIACHHTYRGINSIDWQILVEADFLVNAYEDNLPVEAIKNVRLRVFRTPSGTRMLNDMFGLDD